MNDLKILQSEPDIQRYFYVQRFCFARIGINVLSLQRTTTSQAMFWIPLLSLVFLCFPILLYSAENIQDINKATEALSPFWQIIIVVSKMLYFKLKSKKIITAIHKLWMWNSEAKGKEYEIIVAENRCDVVFSNFYHLSVAITGYTALVVPILAAVAYVLQGEKFWKNFQQPAKGAYHIDEESYLSCIFVYIWNVSATYFLIYGSVAADCLFSWFMCNIVAHFRILKYRLQQAGDGNGGHSSTQAVCDCIAYHHRTLEMTADFIDAFCVIVFIKFAVSCVQVCFLAFKLSGAGELYDQVFYGLFLTSVSVQLILYCYGGQRIENESDSIANEIYQCFDWEKLSLGNKKMLIFSMQRAQLPCKVSGFFFTANLELFLWVYRTAASFVTLLWTLENENDMQ